MPTEMDILVEGGTPERPQPTVPAAPSAQPPRAAATAAPLPTTNAGMATAAATVTTAAAVGSAKGVDEGLEEADIGVVVLPPGPPHPRHPEVRPKTQTQSCLVLAGWMVTITVLVDTAVLSAVGGEDCTDC